MSERRPYRREALYPTRVPMPTLEDVLKAQSRLLESGGGEA